MATTKKAKKGDASVAESMARLRGHNTPGKQLAVLEFIRYRDAGLVIPFDDWVDVYVRLCANDKKQSVSRVLASYATTFGVSAEEQTDVLTGYVDMLARRPKMTFGEYLAELFGVNDSAAGAEASAAPPAEPEPEPEPEPGPDPAADGHSEAEPAAAEPARDEPRTRRRRSHQAAPREEVVEETDLTGRRVLYKAANGRVVHAVCVRHDGGTVDLVDDDGDKWTNVRQDLARLDDGPIIWAITQAQYDQVRAMTAKGRGLWPKRGNNDTLFELVRRVGHDKLCVVAVHNAAPEPFVDAFVFDESAGDSDNNVPFACKPPDDIAAEYVFEVPGVGTIPARVVVQ